MVNIRTGQYNFGQINTPKMADISQIYASVGQQLNKMYYDNRQAYINNIVNPLSQMHANKDDEALLNEKKNAITDGVNAFKESDNWHQASDYIYNTVENIITDEGLALINSKYQQRQAYIQSLKDSGWSQQQQDIFLARSDYYSTAVKEENGKVVEGAFNAVNYGTPYDINEQLDKITNIISKAKASSESITNISAEDAVIKGLANVLNVDGETFVSNFLQTTKSTESVSYDDLYNYVSQRLYNNQEYIDYKTTIEQNALFKERFIPDSNNPRGGTLRDLTPELLKDVFNQSYAINALVGAGISLSDLGQLNDNGTFTLNPNMTEDTIKKLTGISAALGFDMVSYLTTGISYSDNVDIDSLYEFLDVAFNNYIDNEFNNYLKNNNISLDNPNIEAYKENWYLNLRTQNAIQSEIHANADSLANLMSFTRTKVVYDLISNNSVYTTAYKHKKELETKYTTEGFTTASTLPDTPVNVGSTKSIQARETELGETLAQIVNDSRSIPITENMYKVLNTMYGIEPGDVSSINKLDLSEILNNPDINLSDKEREAFQRLHRNNQIEAQIKGEIDNYDRELSDVYNILKDDVSNLDYTSQFIINHNITNYEDYKEHMAEFPSSGQAPINYIYPGNEITYIAKDITDRKSRILTEDEFNKLQQSLTEHAAEIYKKKTGEDLNYTTKGVVIFNPTGVSRQYLDNAIDAIGTSSDSWVLENVQGTKKFNKNIGLSLANNPELVRLLLTHAPTSGSGTIPNIKDVGIDTKETGLPDKTYDIRYNIVYDNNDFAETGQAKQKILCTALDVNGAPLGSFTISRDISKEALLNMIQSDYNNIRTSQIYDNNISGENVLSESRGKIVSQAASHMFSFTPVTGVKNTTIAGSTLNLQARAQQLEVGTGINGDGEKLYVQSNLIIPATQQNIGNAYFEISKESLGRGEYRYKVVMVQPDGKGNWVDASMLDWGDERLNHNFYTLSRKGMPVKNINDAFAELSDYLLSIGYQMNINYGK
jgi:hypothetical protein